MNTAVGVAVAGVMTVQTLDGEDVAEVGILLTTCSWGGGGIERVTRSKCRGPGVPGNRTFETAGELGAVGCFSGGVTVERQGVADAVAATLLVVFSDVAAEYAGLQEDAAVLAVFVTVVANQEGTVRVGVGNGTGRGIKDEGILGVAFVGTFGVTQQVFIVGTVCADGVRCR